MEQLEFAKHLRSRMTESETLLWRHLRAHRLNGDKFRRQQPIGPYVVDFVHFRARLIIEADGGQHNDAPHDERRDTWLRSQGFTVLRFWNNEIMNNLDGVLSSIMAAVPDAPSPPAPLPQGERGEKHRFVPYFQLPLESKSSGAAMTLPIFSTLLVNLEQGIAEIRLNRADKSNAMNEAMWQEIRQAFEWVDATPEARVAILSGEGRNFCAGIDLAMLGSIQQRIAHADGARSREALRRLILELQDCLSSLERCRKPVLAAIHGACVGGALDLVTCCDMRYATPDATFSIKEIDLAMVADVGTLQRMPRLIGEGRSRELAFTGHNFNADEAERWGLINHIFASPEALTAGVRDIATNIAAKSPLATRGLKEVMNFSRDHSVADGLNFVATWNAALLLSGDLQEALTGQREHRPPAFPD